MALREVLGGCVYKKLVNLTYSKLYNTTKELIKKYRTSQLIHFSIFLLKITIKKLINIFYT
ncbi:MAG: hypothetical protein CMF62_01330 [Magnetococcales bacterium]|nr:hypothetical protein [Magnetococcales bacterium]MBA42636.1 hypothetical protein [Magnetococcales bacterium]